MAKDRKKVTFARVKNALKPKDRILIVCEDSKRSVEYFLAFIEDLGINKTIATVKIIGQKPSRNKPETILEDVNNVISKDMSRYGKENCYDRVYCVFDKDKHPCFDKVRETLKMEDRIIDSSSSPCFEFWLLLHFKNTSKSLSSKEILKELKKQIKNYIKQKSSYKKLYFDQLRDKTDTAINNAKNIKETNCSYTNVYLIARDLLKLSKM
ncbi:MAG: RloB family protein [Pseudomonadota bacterium]